MALAPPIPPKIAAVFDQFSAAHRDTLLDVRAMIFDVAEADPRIGPLEEDLRWGEPAYLTTQRKTGSTVRLGVDKQSGQAAVFFNCNTSLVADMRRQFGDTLTYAKNRAVLLDVLDGTTQTALEMGLFSALTYHLRHK